MPAWKPGDRRGLWTNRLGYRADLQARGKEGLEDRRCEHRGRETKRASLLTAYAYCKAPGQDRYQVEGHHGE